MGTTYKDAGVDIEAGDALVDWLVESGQKVEKRPPHQDKIVSGIGGFAALFRAPFKNYKSPCLVSSTDGVGTKVKIASDLNRYETVGQDLVAMCVNDLVCVGAEPLFFLDYYATGKLNLKNAKAFLAGVRNACAESGCALIGGETAEMPGVYTKNDFDCAGFSVGVVEEGETLGAHRVKKGDRLIGIASSGFHSNGYSLLRKVFAKDMKRWADKLLTPTHLYVKLILGLKNKIGENLHATAHITGGGMDNILRVVPDELGVKLITWSVPECFVEVQRRAKISWEQMLVTFNCGIGMVVIVTPEMEKMVLDYIQESGFESMSLGEVVADSGHKWSVNISEFNNQSASFAGKIKRPVQVKIKKPAQVKNRKPAQVKNKKPAQVKSKMRIQKSGKGLRA